MGILELKKQVLTVENGLIKVNFLEESDFDLSKENYYKSKLMSNTELSKIQYNDFFRYLYLRIILSILYLLCRFRSLVPL